MRIGFIAFAFPFICQCFCVLNVYLGPFPLEVCKLEFSNVELLYHGIEAVANCSYSSFIHLYFIFSFFTHWNSGSVTPETIQALHTLYIRINTYSILVMRIWPIAYVLPFIYPFSVIQNKFVSHYLKLLQLDTLYLVYR